MKRGPTPESWRMACHAPTLSGGERRSALHFEVFLQLSHENVIIMLQEVEAMMLSP